MKLPSFSVMLLLGAAVALIGGALFLWQSGFTGFFSLPEAEQQPEIEVTIPAQEKIELIEITKADCGQCRTFDLLKEQLRDQNREFEIREIAFDSEEGQQLIAQYSVGFVPTIIMKKVPEGFFTNWEDAGSVELDGAYVFRTRTPVFWDLAEERLVGLVKVTHLTDPSCAECISPLQSSELQLLLQNISVKEISNVDVSSEEGKALLKKYFLGFAPAAIFSAGVRDYDFFDQFAPLGSVESDGSFVVRTKMPPYKDLDSNSVKGVLNITLIEATQCWACRDAKDLLEFLNQSLGLHFYDISVIDANSAGAQFLKEEYAIEYAPAAVITGDLMLYPGMEETFPKIGRVFTDGVFAFDNPLLLGEGYYYDFNSGEIVTVSAQPAQAG